MSNPPIGVFDSGVGGLSILSGLQALLPDENFLYVADSAFAPYGPRGEAVIRERSEAITGWLVAQGAKAVVVACNTATAAAIAALRASYQVPLIGVEPAVKPAAELSNTGVVGVLATSGTIASDKFITLQNRFTHRAEIVTRACNGLVEQIEAGTFDATAIRALLHQFITPISQRGMDTLVLGCTHYSLIRTLIQEVAGTEVRIVDAGLAVAKETRRRLQDASALAPAGNPGQIRFYTTGNAGEQQLLFSRYWTIPAQVEQLVL